MNGSSKKVLIILILSAFFLVSCAQNAEPYSEFSSATSPSDIVGKWQAAEDRFHYFSAEGVHYYSHSLEQLEDRVENNKAPEGEYWFEEDLHYHTSTACVLKGYDDPGIFKIKLLNENEIKFIIVEDGCLSRMDWLAGPEVEREEYTWTRIP